MFTGQMPFGHKRDKSWNSTNELYDKIQAMDTDLAHKPNLNKEVIDFI